jgi:ArsR family transcriptional regulator
MDLTAALACLAALGQETRLETFRLLMRSSPDGLAAGDIARRLGVVQNTMSAHLGVLTRNGLVLAERNGRSIAYRANHQAIADLLRFLMEDCCQGAPDICAPLAQLSACLPAATGKTGDMNG